MLTIKHNWRKVIFWDTGNIGFNCRKCNDWRLTGEQANYPCKGKKNE